VPKLVSSMLEPLTSMDPELGQARHEVGRGRCLHLALVYFFHRRHLANAFPRHARPIPLGRVPLVRIFTD
jgi:hypothetical protein